MKAAGKFAWTGSLPVAAMAVLLGTGLLTRSAEVAEGVAQGLRVCGGVLIPALFPFMALCTYLTLTDAARIISLPLAPLTRYVFRLPGELGVVALMSMIGGYPVGAKMISSLLEQGRIDSATAERMLTFCVNCSPSFLISAVGAGMFLNRQVGIALFAAQVSATLIVGFLSSLRVRLPEKSAARPTAKGGPGAFVSAVGGASSAMLGMCAFAIFFSGMLYLIKGIGLPDRLAGLLGLEPDIARALIAGLLEVTSGCMAAVGLGGEQAVLMTSLFCSWGGLSVIFQAVSFFGEARPRLRPFLMSRALHCILAAAISLTLYRAFCTELPAMLSLAPPVPRQDSKSWLTALCFLAMCGILISIPGEKSQKKPRHIDRLHREKIQ